MSREAHALINYLLRPDVAAKNTNYLAYANGDTPSPQLIDKAILDDKTVYPDAATMARSTRSRARSEDAAADEPAVDPDQDGPNEPGCSVASGDAATATARDARAPSLRSRMVIACMVP